MTRLILTLLGIAALLLLMPAFARWAGEQRSGRRLRWFCSNAPTLALVAYIIVNLVLTLLSRKPGSHTEITLSLLEPFQRAARQNDYARQLEGLLLNILLFLPLGYLLPQVFRKIKCWQVLLIGAVFTIIIELCQLVFRMGWFDVNDLFYNFIGVLAGWLFHRAQQQK